MAEISAFFSELVALFPVIAVVGAVEIGLMFGLVGLGVFISFRILDFPDLTVDGSLPLGAAVAAVGIAAGWNPLLATFAAMGAGALAGLCTAWLNVRLKILNLLASILTMIALYSINLRIMGKPNLSILNETTLFSYFDWMGLPYYWTNMMVCLIVVVIAVLLLNWFLSSETGLAMRATGSNARMAKAQGVNADRMIYLGMAISNSLVALAGALWAQSLGSADVTMGVGVIVTGLAAVILGEAVLPSRFLFVAIFAAVAGSIVYQLSVMVALRASFIGLEAQDLKLITAILVGGAMTLPAFKAKMIAKRGKKA